MSKSPKALFVIAAFMLVLMSLVPVIHALGGLPLPYSGGGTSERESVSIDLYIPAGTTIFVDANCTNLEGGPTEGSLIIAGLDVNTNCSAYSDSIDVTDTGIYTFQFVATPPFRWSLSVSTDAGDEADIDEAPDDRLNWKRGDLTAVIYPGVDDEDNSALDIYGVDPQGAGFFLCRVTEADLDPYSTDDPPAENTLVKECGEHVKVYILDTGEIQVNIAEPSRTTVLVFDSLDANSMTSYVME